MVIILNKNTVIGDGKSRTNANCLVYHRVGGLITQCLHYPNYNESLDDEVKESTLLPYSTLISEY